MINKIKLFIKQIICNHKPVQTFVMNNHGEKIGCANSSTWKCTKCEKSIYHNELMLMKWKGVFRIWHNKEWNYKGHIILDTSKYSELKNRGQRSTDEIYDEVADPRLMSEADRFAYYNNMKQISKQIIEASNRAVKGKIMIFGTGNDSDNVDGLKEMFYNADSWKNI